MKIRKNSSIGDPSRDGIGRGIGNAALRPLSRRYHGRRSDVVNEWTERWRGLDKGARNSALRPRHRTFLRARRLTSHRPSPRPPHTAVPPADLQLLSGITLHRALVPSHSAWPAVASTVGRPENATGIFKEVLSC